LSKNVESHHDGRIQSQRYDSYFGHNRRINTKISSNYSYVEKPGSLVGITTGYGLDGPGKEFRWVRDFPHLSRPALGPTQPPVQWVPGLSPGLKSGRGVTLTPHPLLVPWSRKSRPIPYSPYGTYGLSRASVPVEYSYTSTPSMDCTACTEPQCLYSIAIPLLPLWAVRPVQSLSACTVELYLSSVYGLYSLYRASVPVQYSYNSTPPMGRTPCTEPQCLYSTAIPLLPLWAVRPVQSLSACTVQLYLNPPYGPYGLYRASVPV